MSRTFLQDIHLFFVSYSPTPPGVKHTERTTEQLLWLALASFTVFNDGREQIFDKASHTIVPGVNGKYLKSEPSSQFANDRLFFVDAPVATGKKFVISTIQIFLEAKGKS